MLGQTCAPLALPDNRILAVYRASPESGRRGLWATTARIEGTDWVEEGEDFCLWGEEQEVNYQPDTPTGEMIKSWLAGQLTSDTRRRVCWAGDAGREAFGDHRDDRTQVWLSAADPARRRRRPCRVRESERSFCTSRRDVFS